MDGSIGFVDGEGCFSSGRAAFRTARVDGVCTAGCQVSHDFVVSHGRPRSRSGVWKTWRAFFGVREGVREPDGTTTTGRTSSGTAVHPGSTGSARDGIVPFFQGAIRCEQLKAARLREVRFEVIGLMARRSGIMTVARVCSKIVRDHAETMNRPETQSRGHRESSETIRQTPR